jgi:transcriptional regulator with XRE-family HTH domain
MARIVDHPVRLARISKGLSQNKLAQLAGVQRSAITAIEDGRTRVPAERILAVLSDDPRQLLEDVQRWYNEPPKPVLKPSAENLLLIPPYTLNQYYRTFGDWRREFASTVTGFASLLRVNPAVVREFEEGRVERMGDVLAGRLVSALGLSPEYLVALEGLKRG